MSQPSPTASGTGESRTPAHPQPTQPPPSVDGEYSGIDPAAMDDFERVLGRAEDTLGRNEPLIRRALERLDLDTSGLSALRETRSWIGTGRPDLRRRSETIRKEQTGWGASSGGVPAGPVAFDEALYGKAARDPDVYAATTRLAEAAKSGEIDEKTLAELEKRTGDATFATALMNALGATRFRGLMTDTVGPGRENDKQAKRLQTALGRTLGTAGSKLGKVWYDELTSDLDPSGKAGYTDWKRGYATVLALKHGTFGSVFLLTIAKKIDACDRQAPLHPNVMADLMGALGRDPAAAQDFFASDPSALKHYLTERSLGDGGEALGKALEAATLTFRDHDGSPDKPSRGYLSAKLASEFVHLEAGRITNGGDSFVKSVSTGRILAGYIGDIDRVAKGGRDPITSGVQGADSPSASGQDPWGAQFNKRELHRVMKEAFTDSGAFAPVLAAQTAFTGLLLDYGAVEMSKGRGDAVLLANAKRIGAGFGMITDAAGLAKIDQGKELDEAQTRNMKVLTAVVNTGLAIPQKAAWPIGAGVIGAWTGLLEDSLKGDAEDRARGDANAAVDRTRVLLHDLTAQAMLKHGLFGSAEPPDKTHPWASLEGMRHGEDPRKNPNNFLEDDGRTLMPMDKLVDEKAAGGPDDRRLEAYERWLYGGLSGKPWQDVEDPLDQGFTNGFARYGA
ncbi:hypothetical protein GCM10010140_45930 [Streptosporangium pseudovulgare]|uniref:Uncharacterized protein n=2 Tax=Streptosporangium pseudovulgare TaxID=35765 RepID=A0ABQ2R3E7_9ACTN|nr:hypothetical protein GCM10010140_45930 [Streptosporangium pseudovulgare]